MSSKLGGPKSAKRKTQIRRYFESTYYQSCSYSDPFEEDEEEVEKCALKCKPLKISFRKNYQEDCSDNECNEVDPDGILVRPDLDEADKFIASLKLLKKRKTKNVEKPFYYSMSREDIELFRVECEKLNNMRVNAIKDESDVDDNVI